jgi:hypothetical protein
MAAWSIVRGKKGRFVYCHVFALTKVKMVSLPILTFCFIKLIIRNIEKYTTNKSARMYRRSAPPLGPSWARRWRRPAPLSGSGEKQGRPDPVVGGSGVPILLAPVRLVFLDCSAELASSWWWSREVCTGCPQCRSSPVASW